MKEAELFFLIFDFTATNSPNFQLLIIALDEKPVENVADVCIPTHTSQYPRYTQLCKVYHFLKPYPQKESQLYWSCFPVNLSHFSGCVLVFVIEDNEN